MSDMKSIFVEFLIKQTIEDIDKSYPHNAIVEAFEDMEDFDEFTQRVNQMLKDNSEPSEIFNYINDYKTEMHDRIQSMEMAS